MASPSVSDIEQFVNTPFDFLVIGGGTAGLPIANRLSEDPNVKVGILEAGLLLEDDPIIDVPGKMALNNGNPKYDWMTATTKQPDGADRAVPIFRGKLVGGSSALNYMGWGRASKEEYDAWKLVGDAEGGWDWDSLLPYFKKSEDTSPEPADLVVDFSKSSADVVSPGIPKADSLGKGGPIKLSYNAEFTAPYKGYVSGWNELGIKTNANPFGGDASGIYNVIRTVDFEAGKRVTATSAYYTPVASRANLKLLTAAHVTKLLFKSEAVGGKQVAEGVEFVVDGKTYTVRVAKEVVLSAGTVPTPQILELSGIGNPKILEKAGIATLVDLPGVGENFHDHTFTRIHYEVKPGMFTLDKLKDPEFAKAQDQLYEEAKKGWRATIDGTFVFIPFNNNTNSSIPDLPAHIANLEKELADAKAAGSLSGLALEQYAIQLEWLKQGTVPQLEFIMLSRGLVNPQPGKSYIMINTGIQHPFGRGSVHIQSADPLQGPVVDPRYLSHEFDVLSLLAAYRTIEQLVKTPSMTDVIEARVAPAEGLSDEDVIKYIRSAFSSGAHHMGTAALARRELGGVVGNDLKVHGTANVRVADASIVPVPVATHIQATVYAIGEKAADLIKADYPA